MRQQLKNVIGRTKFFCMTTYGFSEEIFKNHRFSNKISSSFPGLGKFTAQIIMHLYVSYTLPDYLQT